MTTQQHEPEDQQPACGTCRHASVIITEDDGPVMECHRFPPDVFFDGETVGRGWPSVDGQDWCSEWAPTPDDLTKLARRLA